MDTPLFIKTDNSLLSSLIKIDDLIEYALKNNIKCLTITDDNMYGVIEFYIKCKKNSIKPIIGLNKFGVVLYAKNYNGYKNLIKLNSLDELIYYDDLICITPIEKYEQYKDLFKDIFISYTSLDERNLIKKNNLVYCNEILCLEEKDYKYLKYLYLIKGCEFNKKDNYINNNKIYNIDSNNNKYITDNCNVEILLHQNLMPIYIKEDMTIKEMQIPVSEKIYVNEEELTKYLVFGTTEEQSTYTVNLGDTISTVAFNNKISVNEFLLSNPLFTNENSLLFPGQQVVIGVTNPQISVVAEVKEVVDMVNQHQVYEQIDEDKFIGDDQVIQQGEDGLIRVTQTKTIVNGEILKVDPDSRVVLKESIDEVISRGGKYINNVGSTLSWGWPTNGGWTITSGYGYRPPIFGDRKERELHDGIDIAGTGYRSNIYAANNGVVEEAGFTYVNGNYVIVNHNNGYWTYYGHMDEILVKKGQIVSRGTVLGLMGATGWATGVHVHYSIWSGCRWCSTNPLWYY